MKRYDLSLLFSRPRNLQPSVLSIYLDIDPSRKARLKRGFETQLKVMAKHVERSLVDVAERERFASAMHHVQDFLAAYTPAAHGLVLLFDETDGFFWHQELDFPVLNQIRWDRELFLQPLANAMDDLEGYAVVLLGQEFLRLFLVSLGRIEEIAVLGTRRTGAELASKRMSRLRVIQEMDRLFRTRNVRRFVLAGTPKITAELESLLPMHLSLTVIGERKLRMNADAAEVLSATKSFAEKYEQDNERMKVQEIVVSAAKKGKAVVGLGRTLKAINTDRVWELIYAGDLLAPGYECTQCSALFSARTRHCVYCGSSIEPVDNVVEKAVERALRKQANVEVVRGDASDALKKAGGIGAFLKGQPRTGRLRSSIT